MPECTLILRILQAKKVRSSVSELVGRVEIELNLNSRRLEARHGSHYHDTAGRNSRPQPGSGRVGLKRAASLSTVQLPGYILQFPAIAGANLQPRLRISVCRKSVMIDRNQKHRGPGTEH